MPDRMMQMMGKNPLQQEEPLEEEVETQDNTEDLDFDIIKQIIMSPNVSVEETTTFEEDETEEFEEALEVEKGKKIKYSEKYKKKLLEKAKEDPRSVTVETPRGKMTIDEAIQNGFNPDTGEFDLEEIRPPKLEDHFKDMTPEQLQKLKTMLSPAAMDMTPEEMQRMGIDPDTHPEFSPDVHPEGYIEDDPQGMMGGGMLG